MTEPDWLAVSRGAAPLLLSMPHSGTDLRDFEPRYVSRWLACRDADWCIPELYGFASAFDATIVRTAISRSVVDVNRDPSGRSLYPGMATTELCPTTTFDGEPLYREGAAPDPAEVAARRETYFDPYHAALRAEIERLRAMHDRVVVYDCHSIRSRIPRLFEGELPQFNVGTNDDRACDPSLTASIGAECAASGQSYVVNGRFRGGYITRHYGEPSRGIHALQMELACRGYLREPQGEVSPANWPAAFDAELARDVGRVLERVLARCIDFAAAPAGAWRR